MAGCRAVGLGNVQYVEWKEWKISLGNRRENTGRGGLRGHRAGKKDKSQLKPSSHS